MNTLFVYHIYIYSILIRYLYIIYTIHYIFVCHTSPIGSSAHFLAQQSSATDPRMRSGFAASSCSLDCVPVSTETQ